MRKRIGIEALLAWAYRDELPKAGARRQRMTGIGYGNAWRSILGYGQLLSIVDDDGRNRFGVMADPDAEGEPHPDAIRVYEAVQALEGIEVALPDDWGLLSDIVDIEPERASLTARAIEHVSLVDRDGVRRLTGAAPALVKRHAIMGDAPDWRVEQPIRRFLGHPNGGGAAWFRLITVETDTGPIVSEVDGFDRNRRRPYGDAYRKEVLDPEPLPGVLARADYVIWRAVLDVLADDLAGQLAAHEPLTSERPERPWEVAPESLPRVLPNLKAMPIVMRRVKRAGSKRLAA